MKNERKVTVINHNVPQITISEYNSREGFEDSLKE